MWRSSEEALSLKSTPLSLAGWSDVEKIRAPGCRIFVGNHVVCISYPAGHILAEERLVSDRTLKILMMSKL